ncbi:fragile X mental retardation 1 neighbor protein isoform X1 [Bubalus bubalis]|uniref:fragile X mental retardation 1 neighbor protein isoform X1 n=1 Tax=Bubalus bubalis TaxID=89462 RepID=UPI001E1B8ABB|nr:fragile X mental retardation 1 neighbor protein isoform X1 [Bubalus bubalis]
MSRKRHCPEVFWVLGGHQRGSTSAWRPPRIMPTDRKSTRGRIRSRTLAKIRALQWARSKKVNLGGESSAENPATGSQPRGRMASAQQSRGQATSVHGVRGGTRRSTLKVWVSQRFGLFLIGFWFLLLLCFYMSTGFMDSVSANNYILWSSENADGQSLNETSALGSLTRFFFPTTCVPVEGQVLTPCKQGQDLNKDECLKYKCCYSSVETATVSCFAPLRDKPTQMFRMFGFGAMIMIFLGCLPIYCCSFCWRSRWAGLLRRRFNRNLKRLKKHRKKPKRNTEMLETAVDEEGYGDEKDQETTALFSH